MKRWLLNVLLSFGYTDLSAAKNNFNDDEKIGGGGFGCVYRGTLPGTNEAEAVKTVSATSKQGKHEYESEVVINSKLTHHNLVRFLGWYHPKGDLLLVYELLPNGNLDKYLFGKMEAARRYSIACGIASALVYLREDRHESVVHRDVKASNVIMLDVGLARVLKREKGGHTRAVAGTIGYIVGGSVTTGNATRESDMFNFGALALEIACGRRPNRILDAADEKLGGNFIAEEMERLMKVGLLQCSHPGPNGRLRDIGWSKEQLVNEQIKNNIKVVKNTFSATANRGGGGGLAARGRSAGWAWAARGRLVARRRRAARGQVTAKLRTGGAQR
ncbi:L-type lectin-domain containing receptor kinase IX.1-like [Cryptomeria japonica]|uniref:L-type lectin-domain containing receptor kinase IX.1-like n=1 Tax=Cryptomeria japonica TaxID=3369 RepID=UPI0027DA1605|nr:L-type lectin-domain containing receptor kinase IX.1-like [Cryptomeria japonica]